MLRIDVHIPALAKRSNVRLPRFCAVVLLLTGLSACSEPPYNNVGNAQLQTMLEQNIQIYDIRRPEEWLKTGVIEGSELLTFVDEYGRVMPEFMERLTTEVDRDEPVILICRTGSRTSTLARFLVEEKGYTQVFNVRDGITRWIGDDKPVRTL